MLKFNIQNKAEKIVGYVYTITNKSPKKLRCDLVPMLRLSACNVLENVIRANAYNLFDNED